MTKRQKEPLIFFFSISYERFGILVSNAGRPTKTNRLSEVWILCLRRDQETSRIWLEWPSFWAAGEVSISVAKLWQSMVDIFWHFLQQVEAD
jgi:hypothetical protein